MDTTLTPGFLSEVLTHAGALENGKVTGVIRRDDTPNRGLISEVARLALTYSAGSQGLRPPSVFVKATRAGLHPEVADYGRREVELYQLAQVVDGLPSPRCYLAGYDQDTGESLLITDDLSESHFQRPLPLPPSNHHCELLIDAIARLHARFWGAARLGVSVGHHMTPERARTQTERLRATVPDFFTFLDDALLPAPRAIYDRILASSYLEHAFQRLIALDRVTLIHGDLHTANVMLPRKPGSPVKLIDWQHWDIGVGQQDLAYLMALHWPRERRALFERPLLQRYHTGLIQNGVRGYSWDDCFNDYRRSVATMVLIPIGQFRRGIPTGAVWYGLQHATAAFEDLPRSRTSIVRSYSIVRGPS